MGRLSRMLAPPSAYAEALRAGPGPYDARQTDAGPMQQSMAAQVGPLDGYQPPSANMDMQPRQWKTLAESLGLQYALFDNFSDQNTYHKQLEAAAEERLLDQTPPAPPTNSTYAAGHHGRSTDGGQQTDAGPMQQSMAAPVDPLLEFYDSFANISLGDAADVMLQDYMDNLAVADDPNASTYDKLDAGARVLLGGFEVPVFALGSALTPSGALGTFGGRFAKTADLAAQARAADMLASGDDAAKIWQETGWWQGPDAKWRFEIDDSGAAINPEGYRRFEALKPGQKMPISEVYSNPNLAAAYPESANMPLRRGISGEGGGSQSPDGFEYTNLNTSFNDDLADQMDDALGVLLHEGQHGVQGWDVEDFAPGGVPRDATADAYQNYRRLFGEVEARATARRGHAWNGESFTSMTAAERRATPPWESMDVPQDQWIVRGNNAEAAATGRQGLPTSGDALSSAPMRSLVNTGVADAANDFASRLRGLYPNAAVNVKMGGSAAGQSSYVEVAFPGMRPVEVRVSDHSLGPRRFGDYVGHLQPGADPTQALDNLAVTARASAELAARNSDLASRIQSAPAAVLDEIRRLPKDTGLARRLLRDAGIDLSGFDDTQLRRVMAHSNEAAQAPTGAAGDAARLADNLPMDEASRMARADELFPIEAYHGTAGKIKSFSNSARGSVTQANSARRAHWFVDSPDTASGYAEMAGGAEVQRLIRDSKYAEMATDYDRANALMVKAEQLEAVSGKGENVLPVRLRGNLMEVDADGATFADLDDGQLSRWLDAAEEGGFDGLKIKNFSDEAGYGSYRPATHYAIFNPKNIRSRFAKFDPRNMKKRDLLAGGVGAAGLGLAATGNNAEAGQ